MNTFGPGTADILSAQFDDFGSAHEAVGELHVLGIHASDIEVFALNPAGQHHRFPIGGDEFADSAARSGSGGAIAGATIGGAAGLALGTAAVALAGPAAAAAGLAAGAYAGAFVGAVTSMGHGSRPSEPISRPPGVRIAVRVSNLSQRQEVLDYFRAHGALSIEEAQGTWNDGKWTDFDPVRPPHWLQPPH